MKTATADLSLQASSTSWIDNTHEHLRQLRLSYPVTRIPTRYPVEFVDSSRSVRLIVEAGSALDDLQLVVRRKLGFWASRRLKRLANYSAGWDGHKAEAVRPGSAALAAGFLTMVEKFPSDPSIFLSREGCITLSWEDKAGAVVEISFDSFDFEVHSQKLHGNFPVQQPWQLRNIARSLAE